MLMRDAAIIPELRFAQEIPTKDAKETRQDATQILMAAHANLEILGRWMTMKDTSSAAAETLLYVFLEAQPQMEGPTVFEERIKEKRRVTQMRNLPWIPNIIKI